jgi:hypothetical protein
MNINMGPPTEALSALLEIGAFISAKAEDHRLPDHHIEISPMMKERIMMDLVSADDGK